MDTHHSVSIVGECDRHLKVAILQPRGYTERRHVNHTWRQVVGTLEIKKSYDNNGIFYGILSQNITTIMVFLYTIYTHSSIAHDRYQFHMTVNHVSKCHNLRSSCGKQLWYNFLSQADIHIFHLCLWWGEWLGHGDKHNMAHEQRLFIQHMDHNL